VGYIFLVGLQIRSRLQKRTFQIAIAAILALRWGAPGKQPSSFLLHFHIAPSMLAVALQLLAILGLDRDRYL
jgi:hypothetical protein